MFRTDWFVTMNQGVCNRPCICCHAPVEIDLNTDVDSDEFASQLSNELRDIMGLKYNKTPAIPAQPLPEAFNDPLMEGDLPSLYCFLRDTQYEGGKDRIPGSLSIFVHQGALKMAVNDKDRGLVAFVTAPTWGELLQLVNDGICDDCLEWKPANKSTPQGKIPY